MSAVWTTTTVKWSPIIVCRNQKAIRHTYPLPSGSILDKPDCAAAFKLVEEEKCPAIPETSSTDGLGVNHWMSCIVENASASSVNGQRIHHDCGKGYRYKFDMQINSETGTGPGLVFVIAPTTLE
ncbi:thrombospondin type-1 domain-containing protein 7A [Trichonephila inaurata madagascariensis]|uniref:Thrombospondin type-1 domain-containing protein 7A n=1 Tax=Trichonephila inaurata madagascariensis TaxID=2747483 RepID=A0A8X6MJ62_9ARAC|nr:thrombospondin type-1 domain-containing protein 7A [Trichonephila inaurata madagascariensis]